MSQRTCIVVDDEPAIRGFLSAVLEYEGFKTLQAASAPQAYRLVESMGGAVDLIVSDVQMPGDMSGVDLAFAVRRAFPAIPVILISGYGAPKLRESAFEFIEKPFRPDAILSIVKRLVAPERRSAAASS